MYTPSENCENCEIGENDLSLQLGYWVGTPCENGENGLGLWLREGRGVPPVKMVKMVVAD